MRQNLQPFLLSGAVLFSALGVMWLGHLLSDHQPDTLVVRKLDIAINTPPPPPPKTQNVVEETELTMQIEGKGAALSMADLSVEPDIQVPKPDMPSVKVTNTQWDMPDIALEAFGLSELDSKPTLLTPVKIRFPKRLKKQGVKRVVVKLDVMIDEQGNVKLMDIVENPHHELNKEIMRFVKASKFTSPYKHDEAVKARFIWPVVIEA
ncbi:energy transducer TonB [Aestuariibacter sp. A3R04]|uniref:energy transducer TonB n=1 Tax=Aestuariibacter sp. A3R04 TaxID=2841571 RepID=UPI001C0882B2|nr:energy transducer TonB [Aestuariibacter sp. A3R04]MBU3023961.1 energy transducer TonB [Aestuariibacter sp. A3R04]